MKKKHLLLLALSFTTSSITYASDCSEDLKMTNMSFSEIQTHISEKKFNSIECLIQSLPTKVKSLRTYIKSSLSLQEASPMHPRAIVASPTGSFFMTFNGHKEQKGFDEVEVIALDEKNSPSAWIAGSIKLNKGKLELKKDQRCFSCHGNPIKPIWNKYPSWPNAYGGIDDWLPDPTNPSKNGYKYNSDVLDGRLNDKKIQAAIAESKQFRKFRAYAKNHPRYSMLEKVTDSSSPVFPYTESYRDRNLAFRPNLTLGTLMSLRHSDVLKSRVLKSSFYSSHKSTYLYLQNCFYYGDNRHFSKIQNFVRTNYRASFSTPLASYIPGFEYNATTDALNNLIGINEHEENLQFVDSSSIIKDSKLIGYFSGYYSTNIYKTDLTIDYIRTKFEPNQRMLMEYSKNSYYDEGRDDASSNHKPSGYQSLFLGQDFNTFINGDGRPYVNANNFDYSSDEEKENFKLLCGTLKADSTAEMITPPQKVKEVLPVYPRTHPKALNSCIECHDSQLTIGPRISFKSPSSLSQEEKKDLSDLVYSLTDETATPAHLNGNRMPLGRAPLKPSEVQKIINWINQ